VSMNAFAHALRQRLPANEKLLLILLGDRADPWGGSIFLALDTLQDHAGMSRSTLRRTFRELIACGQIVLEVPATPKSPAFYRLVNVPEPLEEQPVDDSCPHALRRAVLHFFEYRCAWCDTPGTRDVGGDGKPWAVTRVDPDKYGGRFTPDNVTRSCAFCAKKRKRERTGSVHTLAQVVAMKGYQVDTPSFSHSFNRGVQPETPENEAQGSQPDTREVSTWHPGGVNLTPDPFLDPDLDPVQKEQGLPTRPQKTPATPAENIRVITVIAHEAIDQLGPTHPDLAETIKSLCATRRIDYNSAVVQSAIESARWQRKQGGAA